MLRRAFIFLFVLFAGQLSAQDEQPRPRPGTFPADTTRPTVAPRDSLRELRTPQKVKLSPALLPKEPTQRIFRPAELQTMIFEDAAELLENIPGTRISRSGEVGLFAQAGLQGDPPRFTEFSFDGIPWPRGLYGQSNLTALPEVFFDNISTLRPGGGLQFLSTAPVSPTPWTFIEYLNGPFGGDALRIRFRRPLSRKITAYLAGTNANSDGQTLTINNRRVGGTYNAHRLYGRLAYRFNDRIELRYRYVNSDNRAVIAVPFFFEEQPGSQSVQDRQELRLFHSLELAHTSNIGDSTAATAPLDLWRVRVYHWRNQESYGNTPFGGGILHKIRLTGLAAQWSRPRRDFYTELSGRIERQGFDSRTLLLTHRNDADLGLRLNRSLDPRWLAEVTAKLLYREHFAVQWQGTANLTFRPAAKLRYFLGVERKVALPEPEEYQNRLDRLLSPNPDLQPAVLQRVVAGVVLQTARLHAVLQIHDGTVQRAYQLVMADTTFMFANAVAATALRTYTAWLQWQFSSRVSASLSADGSLGKPSEGYLFWFNPSQSLRLQIEYGRSFFGKELGTHVVLRAQYLGTRDVPTDWAYGALPAIKQEDAVGFLEAELRLYYKDAMLFFSFDNILDTAAYWRPQQPMRTNQLRWGINWAFLN